MAVTEIKIVKCVYLYSCYTIQELLGHKDVGTTILNTHVLNQGPTAVRSPVDRLVQTLRLQGCDLGPRSGIDCKPMQCLGY